MLNSTCKTYCNVYKGNFIRKPPLSDNKDEEFILVEKGNFIKNILCKNVHAAISLRI